MMSLKRMVAVALMPVLLAGCGAANAAIGLNTSAKKANQAVVVSMLERGDEQGAREYLVRVGVPEYEVIERIEEARIEILKRAGKK